MKMVAFKDVLVFTINSEWSYLRHFLSINYISPIDDIKSLSSGNKKRNYFI